MARIDGVPMYYRMEPAALRPDLLERFPRGTTTLDLIQAGLRTSTTRRPFAAVGDVITFRGDASPYEIVQVARPDLITPAGRSAWEQAEGWNLGYIDADPKLRSQVYSPSAVQTLFRPQQVRRPQFLIDSRSPSELGRALSPLNAMLSNGLTIEDAYQRAKGYEATFGPSGGKGKPALTPDFDYEGTYQALYDQFARENPDLMRQLAAVAVDADLVHPRARTTQNPAVALSRILAAGTPGSQAQMTPQPQQLVKGVWAFGGSRVTPPEVQEVIARLAVRHGGPVVHGGAPGADRAATRLITDPSLISIYLNGPNDLRGADPLRVGGRVFDARTMPGWSEALKIAQQFEDPYRPGSRTYNARNVMVLLGPQLSAPRERFVVWTPGGLDVGGTGHAIRVANHYGIEVRNLGRPGVMARAMRFLGM